MTTSTDGLVKVKRSGPRGWHWIAAESFNPDVHELFEAEDGSQEVAEKPKRRGAQKTPSEES